MVETGRGDGTAEVGCEDAATAATREESRLRLDKSSPVLIMGVPLDVLVLLLTAAADKLLLLPLPTVLHPCSLDVDPLEDTELFLPKDPSDFEETVFFIFPPVPLLCMLFPDIV